jgi:transcriptional regulator with XRE-family HTH domain
MTITPAEMKASRAILGWSQRELAKRTGISSSTLSSFETRKARPSESFLEAAGVEFAENGGGAGVRLRGT